MIVTDRWNQTRYQAILVTYAELRVMAMRYADNDQVKRLVQGAMKRRLREMNKTANP